MTTKRRINPKAFTLIEMAIAIGILAVILTAVGSIFTVAIKNYQSQAQRSFFQKEINFTSDQINRDIKQAVEVPYTYGGYTVGPQTLILGLPATDNQGNFVYNTGILQEDYIIYYLNGTDLHKKTYASAGSNRFSQNGQDKIILSYVTAMSTTYTPGGIPRQVAITITVSKTVSKKNISVTASQTVDLRNSP